MKTAIALGLLAVLLVACSAPAAERAPATEQASVMTDIKALFASGAAVKCQFTHEGVTSTMYMSGKNQRVETTTAQGASTLISDGTLMYVWTGDQGVKMRLDTTSSSGANVQTPEDYVNNAGDVHCVPWVVMGTMFTPPANVAFTDLNVMMDQYQNR
ncbi:MAG TPA: hypothetical protein VLJ21_01210 [Candidatus Binatia bacterium]|nr:hypothetical protein [Candidatus Binatia bacterium]